MLLCGLLPLLCGAPGPLSATVRDAGDVPLRLAGSEDPAVSKVYLVQLRTREIGIRVALGSDPTGVLQLVLRDGLWLVVAGLGLGMVVLFGVGAWLARADSGSLLQASGDLIHTGPTGTNVMDLMLGLKLDGAQMKSE